LNSLTLQSAGVHCPQQLYPWSGLFNQMASDLYCKEEEADRVLRVQTQISDW